MLYRHPHEIKRFCLFVRDVQYTLDVQLLIRAPFEMVADWLQRDSNRHYWERNEAVYTRIEKELKAIRNMRNYISNKTLPTINQRNQEMLECHRTALKQQLY